MSLQRLSITGIRNLQPVTVFPSCAVNLLYGENGSGKTSFLEAIHLLGLARSFRSLRSQPVIAYDQMTYTVFGEILSSDAQVHACLGITRERSGDFTIRIDGQYVRTAAELAEMLPLQLINPDSFRLLEGSPKLRRQFLDWGVFHVEPRFLSVWQRVQQALRQRNSLLRHGKIDTASEVVWSRELAIASDQIDQFRRSYIQRLKPIFDEVLARLIQLSDLKLSYHRGWDKDRSLEDVLASSLGRDRHLGYTQIGPQRADLRLRVGHYNAVDVLSRGQQKLVVCALRIAQGYLLNETKQGRCIYLIDDLPSELDVKHREALCRLLEDLQCQVFITCIEPELLKICWRSDTPVSTFHVEHGSITQIHDSLGVS